MFTCLPLLGPLHLAGIQPGPLSQSPMKCPISVCRFLSLPFGSVDSPKGTIQKDLTLLHLGSPRRPGNSLLSFSFPFCLSRGQQHLSLVGPHGSVLLLEEAGQVSSDGPRAWALGSLDCSPPHTMSWRLRGHGPVPERCLFYLYNGGEGPASQDAEMKYLKLSEEPGKTGAGQRSGPSAQGPARWGW